LKKPKELFLPPTKPKLKLKPFMTVLISLKSLPEPDSKNSMLTSSKKPWDLFNKPSMTQVSKKIKSMKSSLSEDLLEFPKLDNLLKISSMEKNLILVLTLMRQLLMVLLFREVLFVEILLKKLNLLLLLMLPLLLWELKPSEEL